MISGNDITNAKRPQLEQWAREFGISGYAAMNVNEIKKALRTRRNSAAQAARVISMDDDDIRSDGEPESLPRGRRNQPWLGDREEDHQE